MKPEPQKPYPSGSILIKCPAQQGLCGAALPHCAREIKMLLGGTVGPMLLRPGEEPPLLVCRPPSPKKTPTEYHNTFENTTPYQKF